jgi:alanine dehydrogenase
MKTNQLKRVFALAGLALLGTQLFAQELFEIKVKLIKTENQASNHATATLLDSKTMEIVAQNISNESGEILIENIKKGQYVLMVQKPGYKKTETRFIDIDEKGVVSTNDSKTLAENAKHLQKTQLN